MKMDQLRINIEDVYVGTAGVTTKSEHLATWEVNIPIISKCNKRRLYTARAMALLTKITNHLRKKGLDVLLPARTYAL